MVEYWQGGTSVNIQIEKKINNTLPAITICLPWGLSFQKLSKLDEFENPYTIYLNQLEKYENGSKEAQDEMINIYKNVTDNVAFKILNNQLDLIDVVTEYSLI